MATLARCVPRSRRLFMPAGVRIVAGRAQQLALRFAKARAAHEPLGVREQRDPRGVRWLRQVVRAERVERLPGPVRERIASGAQHRCEVVMALRADLELAERREM